MQDSGTRRFLLSLLVLMLLALPVAACGAGPADGGPPEDEPFVKERDLPPDPAQLTWPQEQVVYFATDRAPETPTLVSYLMNFVWAVGLFLLGWLLVRSGRKIIKEPYQWRVTTAKWLVTFAVLAMAGWAAWHCLRTATLHGRVGLLYGGDRLQKPAGDEMPLDLGLLTVSIPEKHEEGVVERPSPFTGDFFENTDDHMVLTGVWVLSPDDFFARVRSKVGDDHDVLVFVHGYNSSFEASALRAAQIAWDLGFTGAPILYSWPSQGTIPGYLVDAANANWTVPHLHLFLKRLLKETQPARVHLIAHSMGNRALTGALRRLRREAKEGEQILANVHQIVLAAPDIDADTFRTDIAPAITTSTARVTLYASKHDHALESSKIFHGGLRAGQVREKDIVVVPGVETVDVSKVSGGHSYIGNNGRVLDDLGRVLDGEASAQRVKQPLGELFYWRLETPAEPEGSAD